MQIKTTEISPHNYQKGCHQKNLQITQDFHGGAVVGNLPANAGDKGSIPGPGRSQTPRSS